jgi:peptide/nickel transport system permease protein
MWSRSGLSSMRTYPGRLARAIDRRRTPLFISTTAALVAWICYDAFLNDGFTLGTWLAEPLEWLFILSLIVFGFYVVVPLAGNPIQRRRVWTHLTAKPETQAAVVILAVFFVVGTFGPMVLPKPKLDFLSAYQPPVWGTISAEAVDQCAGRVVEGRCHGSWQYPLGTDRNGYRLGRLLVGASRVSVYITFVTSMLVVPISVAVGTTAGYVGGVVDSALMRYTELQDTVPALVVYLFVLFFVGESLFLIIILFGFLGWGGTARLVRSEVRQKRKDEFVTAAENLGGTPAHVLFKHVLPNVSNTVLLSLTHLIPVLLLTEVGIAYLGFESFDLQSFGNIIARGISQEEMLGAPTFQQKWWVGTLPAVVLSAIIASFKLIGDVLRDAMDPRVGR